jgi:hypothetical protein
MSILINIGRETIHIISFIEDMSVIREILQQLGLWLVRSRPPPACATHLSMRYTQAGAGGPKIHNPSLLNLHLLISTCILHIHMPTVTPTLNTLGMNTYNHTRHDAS